MATYYTKCGRKFTRSSKAEVTGYHLEEDVTGVVIDQECAACPFVVDVKEGWPGTHKRYECRAGSQPPNHENDYRGNANDKCTLQVHSIDHVFLESIREWAQSHPELSASYNADSCADCRRTLSVTCSQNKKGEAAKQELIDKFFPVIVSDSCRTCVNSEIFKKLNHAGSAGNCHKNSGCYPIYIPDSKCKDFRPLGTVPETFEKEKQETPPVLQEPAELMELQPAEIREVASGFDYSALDAKTADTLRAMAGEITRIKMQTVYDIGLHLSLANDALAKAGHGTFGAWCESIGFSRQAAQNYMQAYDFICRNFDRPEQAIGIQPSLLFAASKPSAPPELAQAVADGDITKHKDYMDALAKLKAAEEDAATWRRGLDAQKELARGFKLEMVKEAERSKGLEKQVEDLQRQLASVQPVTADPVKVIEIREVVPENICDSWYRGIEDAIERLVELDDAGIELILKIAGQEDYALMKSSLQHRVYLAAKMLNALEQAISDAPVPRG